LNGPILNGALLQTGYFVLAGILILVGLAGAVVPILPGVPLVFGGMLLAAWADHFRHIGAFTLSVLGILAALALLVDFLAGVLGAKRVGASTRALWGASIGMLVGFFFGLPGLLLGPFVGAVIGELSAGGKLDHATRVGVGTWIGLLFGTLAKLALCFTMLGVFALAFVIG
jgi:uncharacterized protein YqgC (DUF456 family)